MRSEIVQITKHQYEQFKKGEEITEIIDYFKSITKTLPKELKDEVLQKGFTLEEGNISMEILTLHVVVPNASNKLKHEIANNFIFCYLD